MNNLGTRCQMLATAKKGDYNCEGVSISRLLISEREVKEQARTLVPGWAKAIFNLAQNPWRAMFVLAAFPYWPSS
jgi:hypothetical protein